MLFAGYFLIVMHIFLPNVGGFGLYIPYNVFGWIFISALVGVSLWDVGIKKSIKFNPSLSLFLLGFIFFIIPYFYPNGISSEFGQYRLLYILGGLLYYYSFIQLQFIKEEKHDFLYVILGAICIQSVVGLIQYFGLLTDGTFLLTKKYVAYGGFMQRNAMSSFMATGIMISLFLMNGLSLQTKFKTIKKGLIFTIPLLASIIIMAVKSKAGYLGLIIGMSLFIPNLNFTNTDIRKWILLLFTGMIIGYTSPKMFPSKSLLTRSMDEQAMSINVRLIIWDTTIDLWQDSPMTGIGYGNFTRRLQEKIASRYHNENDFNYVSYEQFDHPHNEILLWMVEGGLCAIIGIIIMIYGFLLLVLKQKWKTSMPYLALIIPIVIHSQVEFPFDTSIMHWMIFLLFIQLLDQNNVKTINVKSGGIFKIAAIFVPLITTMYMWKTLNHIHIITEFESGGSKNYQLLNKIDDPGPLHLKYNLGVLNALSDIGLRTHNRRSLELFIEKAQTFVSHTPLVSVYERMEYVYHALGMIDEANTVRKEGMYFYPELYKEVQYNGKTSK